MDALSLRLDEAVVDLGTQDGLFIGIESDGEIVVALEKIVAIMREVAPLLANLKGCH